MPVPFKAAEKELYYILIGSYLTARRGNARQRRRAMKGQKVGIRGFHLGADGVRIDYELTRSKLARFGFYLVVAALALAVWRIQQHLFATPYLEPLKTDLTSLDQQQLSAFLEMNRLLITLGTAILGGLGFVLSRSRRRALAWRELWPVLASALFAGFSLYFGYVAYQCILWMLQNGFFDLNNAAVLWARHYHFYSLLLSVFFFADFFIHDTSREDRHDPLQNATAA